MKEEQKKPSSLPKEVAPTSALVQGDNSWVMVFNVITGKGKDEQKKTFKLHKRRALVGSATSSDIRIQQNSVSNVHAVIEMDEQGKAHIYDMASETGIFVNDKKTVSQDLKDGDEIRIGFATLVFRLQALQEVKASLPAASVRKSSSGARSLFYNEKEDFRPLILEDERNVIQIFDYAKSTEQALQVSKYWGEMILDVSHHVGHDPITIGDDKTADYMVPGVDAAFPLVSFEGNDCVIRFTEEMTGVLRTNQQLIHLEQLKEEKRKTGAFKIILKQNDLLKLQIRGITFFLSYSPMPPHLRAQKILERDPLYTKIWFTSLALTTALVILAATAEKPAPITVDELPQRVATIIFQPPPEPVKPPPVAKPKEEVKPEEKVEAKPPKKLPTEVKHTAPQKSPQHVAKTAPQKAKPTQAASQVKGQTHKAGGDQGEGAKAAGAEGKKGQAHAKPSTTPQNASHGNPNTKTAAKSQGAGKGNVESLAGDLQGAISKSLSAGGKGASEALGKLHGYGGFTTQGNGGLGAIGAGSGGGGNSLDVSGLGTKGLGEGAVGKGLGAIGSGGNIIGTGHGRPNIEVGNSQDTIIMGGLDKDLIDKIIKQHLSQIRYCYEKEANTSKADLRGRVMMRFVISASGRVSQSGVESTSLGNANVEKCLVGIMQRIVFPEPLGGGIVEVSYPFLFAPALSSK